MLTLEMRVIDGSVIKLDCINKRVYSFVKKCRDRYCISSDYNGGNQSEKASGTREYILGVFGGSLYFMNIDWSHLREMTASRSNVIRSIAVNRNAYYDLIVVHKSLQPLGKLYSCIGLKNYLWFKFCI